MLFVLVRKWLAGISPDVEKKIETVAKTIAIIIGIIAALGTIINVMVSVMQNLPSEGYGFFFGVIVGAILLIAIKLEVAFWAGYGRDYRYSIIVLLQILIFIFAICANNYLDTTAFEPFISLLMATIVGWSFA